MPESFAVTFDFPSPVRRVCLVVASERVQAHGRALVGEVW